MYQSLGVLFALGALGSWAIGDFYIQKTARTLGVWKALVFIASFGGVVLFPFIVAELPSVITNTSAWLLLGIVSLVAFFAALFDFQALKDGKIAIIEPIVSFELPLTIGLSIVLLHEQLSLMQMLLVIVAFLGIMLTVTKHLPQWHYHRRLLERGVVWAGLGAIGMGLTNFLTGVGSQQLSPLLTIWFTFACLAVVSLLYLGWQGQLKTLRRDLKRHGRIIFLESFFDTVAWLCFAFATTLIPVAITTTISEGYVVIAAALGIFINHERLKKHQIIGIILALGSILILSVITGE